jgi:hypothetical protein
MHRPTLIALVALLAAGSACDGSTEPSGPELSPAELRHVPTTAGALAGIGYRLDGYLWRDFMPTIGGSGGGSPLMAALEVTVVGASEFPASVTVDRLWVLNGDEVWATRPVEEQPRGGAGATTLAVMAREGPKWGPGITVDVVVRLRAAGGATTLLRAAGQPIHRTD